MEILNLSSAIPAIIRIHNNYALNLKTSRELWIFNCCEGCQHTLGNKKIKINLISKIIITNLNISNLSGLPGLLSSLSLINRKKALHIYSNEDINKYLQLGIKYSKTNFKYNIYFHIIKTGLIINHNLYKVYAFINILKIDIVIISKEKFGTFRLKKAKNFNIKEGPLYGQLKQAESLLFPDGIIVNGEYFTDNNKAGKKISTLNHKFHNRSSIEVCYQCNIIHSLL